MMFIRYERLYPPMTSQAPLCDGSKCCQADYRDEIDTVFPWGCTREDGHEGNHEAGDFEGKKMAEWD